MIKLSLLNVYTVVNLHLGIAKVIRVAFHSKGSLNKHVATDFLDDARKTKKQKNNNFSSNANSVGFPECTLFQPEINSQPSEYIIS